MTIPAVVLLLLTLAVWVLLLATLLTMPKEDPAGRGLAGVFAVFATIGLWLLLGGIVVAAGMKATLPPWSGLAALILLPASCAAALVVAHLFGASARTPRWPIVVPAVIPLLIVGFAAYVCSPSLRTVDPSAALPKALWVVVALLSALSLVAKAQFAAGQRPLTPEAQARAERIAADSSRRERQAAFGRLTAHSPLWEWMYFAEPDSDLRELALEEMRKLPRRNAEAAQMIAEGRGSIMRELPFLALDPTEDICNNARAVVARAAADLRPTAPEPPHFQYVVRRVDKHFPALRWLTAGRCDCWAELEALRSAALLYPDGPERVEFLEALDSLRKAR